MAQAPLRVVTPTTDNRTVVVPLPARGERAGRPAVGPDRLQHCDAGGAPSQARHAQHAPDPGRRDAGVAPASAKAGAQVAVRIHPRACRAVRHGRLCSACGAAGAAARLGFKAHPHMLRHACGFALANKGCDTRALQSLPWPQDHPAHSAIHRVIYPAVQGLLAMSEARRPANARRSPPVRFQPAHVACVVPQRVPILRQRGQTRPPGGRSRKVPSDGTMRPGQRARARKAPPRRPSRSKN